MGLEFTGKVGPAILTDGAENRPRLGRLGSLVTHKLHGDFYEQNIRGNIFMTGSPGGALTANNAVATGLTATATPLVAVWNPPSSGVNLSIIRLILTTTLVANTAVAPGGFMWVGSAGQNNISTGTAARSCKTLLAAGSQTLIFTFGTALTGLVGSLVQFRAANIGSINAPGQAAAIPDSSGPTEEFVNGSIIVPPGAVVGVMNSVSTTTVSMNAGLIWEEIAV